MCRASGLFLDAFKTALAALRTSSWSSIVEVLRREVRVAAGFDDMADGGDVLGDWSLRITTAYGA